MNSKSWYRQNIIHNFPTLWTLIADSDNTRFSIMPFFLGHPLGWPFHWPSRHEAYMAFGGCDLLSILFFIKVFLSTYKISKKLKVNNFWSRVYITTHMISLKSKEKTSKRQLVKQQRGCIHVHGSCPGGFNFFAAPRGKIIPWHFI